MRSLRQFLTRFRRRTDGAMNIFGLYIFISMAVVGGVGVDVSNVIAARTQLQNTADAVAHAALYNRENMSAADAKAAALAHVQSNMPTSRYGTLFNASDIVFGDYDYATDTFTANPNSKDGVAVILSRVAANSNSVGTFLMQFIGVDSFDVRSQSIFVTYYPSCFQEGFMADDVVDIQSNNSYFNGFCIHSNTHVEINQNNFFEPGTIVSMPDLSQLVLPNSGFNNNTGLEDALREGRVRMRLLNRINSVILNATTFGTDETPDYITDPLISTHNGKNHDVSDFDQNRINIVSCNGGSINITPDVVMENIVLFTTCGISFKNNAVIENSVVITTSTAAKSITGSGIQIGRDDNCAADGGSQFITLGGVEFPANLAVFGSQIIAMGNIEFAARADGIQGASFVANGRIDGTSNMNMAFCGGGMERNFRAAYFRLAR